MRVIELSWNEAEWGDGVAEELVETMLDGLEEDRRALPDEWRVLEVHEDEKVRR